MKTIRTLIAALCAVLWIGAGTVHAGNEGCEEDTTTTSTSTTTTTTTTLRPTTTSTAAPTTTEISTTVPETSVPEATSTTAANPSTTVENTVAQEPPVPYVPGTGSVVSGCQTLDGTFSGYPFNVGDLDDGGVIAEPNFLLVSIDGVNVLQRWFGASTNFHFDLNGTVSHTWQAVVYAADNLGGGPWSGVTTPCVVPSSVTAPTSSFVNTLPEVVVPTTEPSPPTTSSSQLPTTGAGIRWTAMAGGAILIAGWFLTRAARRPKAV